MANVVVVFVINTHVLSLSLNGSKLNRTPPMLVFVRHFLKCHFDELQGMF